MTTEQLLLQVSGDASQAVSALKTFQSGVKDAFGGMADGAQTAGGAVDTTNGLLSKLGGILGETQTAAVQWGAAFLAGAAIFEGVQEAYRSMTEFIESSVTAFADAESAERRLTTAIETQGLAIPGLSAQYLALGRSYEQTTTFSHTALDAAEALFTQLGNIGPGMMGRALQAATDLAAGLGIDLNQAVELLSKAAEGQTATFSRYGIVLDQTRVQAEGFGYVLDAVEAKVGGQAQAEVDTYAGHLKQLGNEWASFKENLGGFLVQYPLVTAGFDALANAAESLGAQAKGTSALWVSLISDLSDTSFATSLAAAFAGSMTEEQKYLAAFQNLQRQIDAFNAQQAENAALAAQGKTPVGRFGFDQSFLDANAKGLDAWNAAVKAFQSGVDAMTTEITHADLAEKVRQLQTAVTDLGGASQLAADKWVSAADAAAKLGDQGAILTPELRDLANVHTLLSSAAALADANLKAETASFAAWQKTAGAFMANLPLAPLKTPGLTAMVAAVDVTGPLQQQAAATKAIMDATFNDIAARMKALGVDTQEGLADTATQARADFDDMAKSGLFTAQELEAAWQKYVNAAIAAGHGLRLDFLMDLTGMAGAALDAFASGGSVTQALQSSFVTMGKGLSQQLLAGPVKDLAKSAPAFGAALGSLAGPLGGAAAELGLDLGKKLWDALFGDAGRQAVEQFAATFQGGFAGLHDQLSLLDAQGEQLWVQLTQGTGNNNAAQAAANIKAVQDALSAYFATQNTSISNLISQIQTFGGSVPKALDPYIQKLQEAGILTQQNADDLKALEGSGVPSYDQLTQLQQKYNLTAAEMGPSFQAEQIDAQFQTLIDDMDELTRGGVNLQQAMFTAGANGALSLTGLGTAIQTDIQQAINAGVAIPANLKPAAQSLIDQGLLLDASGQKITNINQLTFGETLQTSLDKLNDTLQQLIKTISQGLPDAMNSASSAAAGAADAINRSFKSITPPDMGTDLTVGAATGGIITPFGLHRIPDYFAFGGPVGTDTVPAMLTPGEMVLTAAHQRILANALTARSGASAAGNVVVEVTLTNQTHLDGKIVDRRVQKLNATGRTRTRSQPGRSF